MRAGDSITKPRQLSSKRSDRDRAQGLFFGKLEFDAAVAAQFLVRRA